MMVIIDPPSERQPTDPVAEEWGQAVFQLRRALKLSQPAFGALIRVHAATVSAWERRARTPNLLARAALQRLAAERGLPFLEGK